MRRCWYSCGPSLYAAKNILSFASVFMFGAKEALVRSENMDQRGFSFVDSTNSGEELALHEHGVERLLGLGPKEKPCDVDGSGGKWQRFGKPAQFSEDRAHHLDVLHASTICAQFHHRSDSRQNLERIARSTDLKEGPSPHDLCGQDVRVIDWIVARHASACFFVQTLGNVELFAAQ
mmetsp:Transcript_25557/g.101892  ORF Transcript_25557/g.101892 Transcript_25557/m.101892 type:complete len:177 (-) Transcript_25557:338-868(-)